MKRTVRGIVYAILIFATAAITSAQDTPDVESETPLTEYRDRAIEWLLAQKVPNETIPSPVPTRRNLVISYEVPTDDPAYPFLVGRSYIYDAAITAIAFTMVERYRDAEDVLLALSRQLLPDGTLWFGVNVHNEWPSQLDHQGATIRSGASAWAGYAATFYLRTRATTEPGFHENDRVGRRILSFARDVADSLIELQITDPDDPRYGLVTGGMGTYSLSVDDDGQVISVYDDGEIGWVSTEHNVDLYFLVRDLALLTSADTYHNASNLIVHGMSNLWDDERGQLIQGIKRDGRRDTVLPLDTASWGSMMLRAAGEVERADRTLDAGFGRFQIDDSRHFRPYAADPVFSDAAVNGAFFGDPDIVWNDIEMAWPEGSLGMATALVKAGRSVDALPIIEASMSYSQDGALQYASQEVPHQFSVYPSVASTAWLVIAIENVLDLGDRKTFWSYR